MGSETEYRNRSSAGLIILLTAVATVISLYTWSISVRFYASGQRDNYVAYLERIGVELHDYDSFILNIKNDNNLSDHSIRVFVGLYMVRALLFNAAIKTDRLDPKYHCIFIEQSLFELLNTDEKKALVAHEIGHIIYPRRLVLSQEDYASILQSQINADVFALKYVTRDSMVSLLTKLASHSPEIDSRLEVIKKIK